MSTEIKVGLLFFLAIGVALWFTIYVNKVGAGGGVYQIYFPRVVRLKEGDQVSYNGVRVGMVTEVAPDLIDGEPWVRVGFNLDADRRDKVLINPASRYRIVQGLLGGSQLDISSRSGQPITPERLTALRPRGDEPVGMDEAFNSIRNMVEENRENLKAAISSVDTGMHKFGKASDEITAVVSENRPELKRAISAIADAGTSVTKIIEENRPAVTATIASIDKAAKQVAELIAENRPALQKAIDQFPEAVKSLIGAATKVDKAANEIQEAVAENRKDLRTTLENAAKFSDRLVTIGEDVKAITGQIASGKGTIGKLVFQDDLHDKTVAAVDSFSARLDEVKPVTQGLGQLKFFAGLDVAGNAAGANFGTGLGYAYLRIEPKPWKFYEGGVSYRTGPTGRDVKRDDPDKLGIDFNLLIGWRFLPDDLEQTYRLTLAGGAIDSKIGGLISTTLYGDRLTATLLVRGKDYTRPAEDRRFEDGGAVMVRAWAELRVWERVSVQIGGTDLASRNPGVWFGLRAEILDNDLRNLTAVSSLAP
ncbi:hypothetical protein LBMAG53_07830 [Planctomycetota bacterium]|nr:hypothetical protein LBMAG53_07830 [Planctomycetota bacterium]